MVVSRAGDEKAPESCQALFHECSVEPVHHYSNKSVLLPPPLVELQKLADLTQNFTASAAPVEQVSRSLRQRLEPDLVKQIASEYESGATTPSLCKTYGVSKTGMLRLLRDEGVALRRRPLTVDRLDTRVQGSCSAKFRSSRNRSVSRSTPSTVCAKLVDVHAHRMHKMASAVGDQSTWRHRVRSRHASVTRLAAWGSPESDLNRPARCLLESGGLVIGVPCSQLWSAFQSPCSAP